MNRLATTLSENREDDDYLARRLSTEFEPKLLYPSPATQFD